jgi:hypothetical protein
MNIDPAEESTCAEWLRARKKRVDVGVPLHRDVMYHKILRLYDLVVCGGVVTFAAFIKEGQKSHRSLIYCLSPRGR